MLLNLKRAQPATKPCASLNTTSCTMLQASSCMDKTAQLSTRTLARLFCAHVRANPRAPPAQRCERPLLSTWQCTNTQQPLDGATAHWRRAKRAAPATVSDGNGQIHSP
eukprot:15459402-Alexandrium_andersonii.AAC.1